MLIVWVVDSSCYCKCWGCAQGGPGWMDLLPDCPCALSFDAAGDPVNPNPGQWDAPKSPHCCHPGAEWCIRSECSSHTFNDTGQQCCYDAGGILITGGEGAGTPDLIAPCGPLWGYSPGHMNEDVASFRHCKKAGMLSCYWEHRTPNNGNGCECNPPDECPFIEKMNPCGCDV